MNRTAISLAVAMLFSPALSLAETLTAQKLWETQPEFKNPESAIYDETRDTLYISNVDGDAMGKDGYGSISRMTPDGNITDLQWVTGLNAPKGMAIVDDKLYVADIDTLIEIDLATGAIGHRYGAPGAQFLNDVTADSTGNVYVSDMMTNRIHWLHNGVFEVWLEGPMLENPNGLLAVGDKLYLGTWGAMKGGFNTPVPGHIKVISLTDKSVIDFGSDKPVGNMDGIEILDDGSILATDWMAGGLMTVAATGEVTSLLDLAPGSADHEYIPAKNLVIIPMMQGGTVAAYQLETVQPAAESDGP